MKSLVLGAADGIPRGAATARLSAFLNSSFGVLLVGSLIGAVGLFTWQRQDWVFKEKYYRSQVMVDRRLNLVEQINRDTGRLVAAADDVIAACSKPISKEQKNEVVRAYNKEEAQWFGNYGALQALLAFYFPEKEVAARFAAILAASQELDRRVNFVWEGNESPEQAAETSKKIKAELQALNQLALQRLLLIERQ